MKCVKLVCAICGITFNRPQKEYNRQVRVNTTSFYCSRSCGAKFGNDKRKSNYIKPSHKICIMCGDDKLLTEFNSKISRRDGVQQHCRECNRLMCKAYYAANTEHHKKVTSKRKKQSINAGRELVYDYLSKHSCVDCGEADLIVLEFDHVRGKKRDGISTMVAHGCSTKSIIKEIEKCEVRCANCHRRKTAKDFEWYKHNQQIRDHSSTGRARDF